MNEQLLNKILEEFEEKIGSKLANPYMEMFKKSLKDFVIKACTTTYQAGQDDLKKKILEEMSEYRVTNYQEDDYNAGYNECREEIIEIINKL